MIYSTTISKKGQITIPKPIRDFLGLFERSKVLFEVNTMKGKMVNIIARPDILELAGSVKPRKNKNIDPVKAREYMETHYERI